MIYLEANQINDEKCGKVGNEEALISWIRRICADDSCTNYKPVQ